MPAKRGSQPNDQLDELRKRLRTAEQALKQRESELQREKERRDELGSVVQKARKVFECPVCLNLCLPHRAPVLLAPCAHLFCRDCVEVVANAVAPANASCPMCSALFRAADIKDLKTSNIALHRQLLGLHIDCPLECDWTGDVGDLDTHFESCGMAKCEASGCDAVIKLPDTVPVRFAAGLKDSSILAS